MDFLFFDDIWKKSRLIPGTIIGVTVIIILLNIWGLGLGITYVFPHLFYIPIILTAYYYPRRGVPFALGISVVYCALSLVVIIPTTAEILSALARAGVFVLIAAVVSYLSGRMHHDTQMCRRLVSVVKYSIDAIIGENMQGFITDWNTGAQQLYGYSAAEIVGTPTTRLIPPELRNEKHQLLQRAQRGETVERVETERIRKDGTRIHVSLSLSPIYNNKGEFIGVSNIAHDITERKRAEEALRQSEVKFHTMADFTVDWEYWIAPDNRFVYISPSCKQVTGYSAGDFFRTPGLLEAIVHPEDRNQYAEHLRTIHGDSREGHMDFRIIRKDHDTRWIEHSCKPVHDKDGTYLGRRVSNRDITERKQLEEALRMANRKLNLLASITRHDIRNQLLALNGYIGLSMEFLDNPDQLKDFLAKEQKVANAIDTQITFTKDYENLGIKSPVWQEVEALVRRAEHTLPLQDIRLFCSCSGLEIYADPLLEKVFYNLIDNSLRYGGEKMTSIRVTADTTGELCRILCEDDGNGISAEDKTRLFTKGFGKHTGLGLFLSREILSITGITITETGEPGRGARFEIAVPEGKYRYRN